MAKHADTPTGQDIATDKPAPGTPKYDLKMLYELEVDKIKDNPDQPRKSLSEESIKLMAESIAESGLHEPIIVKEESSGDIILVAGQRRLEAHRSLKQKTIKAIFTDANPLEVALIENLAREDMHPFEEAEALRKIIDDYHYNQDVVAKKIGKTPSAISKTLKITKIDPKIKDLILREAPACPKWILQEIGDVKDKTKQRQLFKKHQKLGLTREEYKRGQNTKPNPKQPMYVVTALTQALTKLDPSEWSTDDKNKLKDRLVNLNHSVNEVLEKL